jgi:hypothetical protein
MSNPLARDESGKPNFRAFKNNGFVYGLPVGALVGVLIAGPHFYEWSAWKSLATILGCCAGTGILGYFAIALAYGSEATGSNVVVNSGYGRDFDGFAEYSDNGDSGGSCDSGGDGNGGN